MAESATEKELVNQGAGSEHEADAIEGLYLRETVEATQQSLTDQHGHLQEVGDDQPEGPRRSERARHPTEKMSVLQEEEAK